MKVFWSVSCKSDVERCSCNRRVQVFVAFYGGEYRCLGFRV